MHGGQLHMVYVDSNKVLHHGVFSPSASGGSWSFSSMDTGMPNFRNQWSDASPSLTEVRGVLTCVYRALDDSDRLFVTELDDGTGLWRMNGATLTTALAPSCAGHDGLLYIAYLSDQDANNISYTTWDGQAWGPERAVNYWIETPTALPPTLVSFAGSLMLLFINSSSKTVNHYLFTNGIAPAQDFVPLASPGITSPFAVAAAGYNGLLNMALTGSDDQVYIATFDGARWSAPAATGGTAATAPSMAAQAELLQLTFVDRTGGAVVQTGLSGGIGPLSRIPLQSLEGGASAVATSVPTTMFAYMRPYTVEAWVKLASTDGVQYIVSSFDVANDDGQVALALKEGKFAAYRDGQWLNSTTTPKVGEWYHLAFSFDGAAYANLYVNGTIEATEIGASPSMPNSTAPLMIGAASKDGSDTPASRLDGSVRWVALWERERSSDDILEDLYVRPEPQAGLSALFDFSGVEPLDQSGREQQLSSSGSFTPVAETMCLQLAGGQGVDCGTGSDPEAPLSYAGDEAMSLEAWVYPTSSSATALVIQRSGEYSLGLDSQGWFGAAGGQSRIHAGPAPALRQWTHVALTRSAGGRTTLYVNGDPVEQETQATTGTKQDTHTSVGSSTSGGSGLHGSIASARVWSRELNVNEVATAMTQSPAGMAALAANYDFATTPVLDATGNNTVTSITDPSDPNFPGDTLFPKLIGAPSLAYLRESITTEQARTQIAVQTIVSSPYFPDERIDVLELEPPPPAPATPAPSEAQLDALFSPEYHARLMEDFHRSLPASTNAAARDQLAREHAAKLDKLFIRARANPERPLGGFKLDWVMGEQQHTLVLDLLDGQRMTVGVVDAAAFTETQMWWVKFIMTLVFGFANILGFGSPGSKVSNKLLKYITKNGKVVTLMEKIAVTAITDSVDAIGPALVWQSLTGLWKGHFLTSMMKIIAKNLSWWSFAKFIAHLALLFVPGAQEARVAEMMVAFAELAIDLSMLALSYPSGRKQLAVA